MGIIEAQELNSFLPADDNCYRTRFATSCERSIRMKELSIIAELIANDAFACTFQTMGQYRVALIRKCTELVKEKQNEHIS